MSNVNKNSACVTLFDSHTLERTHTSKSTSTNVSVLWMMMFRSQSSFCHIKCQHISPKCHNLCRVLMNACFAQNKTVTNHKQDMGKHLHFGSYAETNDHLLIYFRCWAIFDRKFYAWLKRLRVYFEIIRCCFRWWKTSTPRFIWHYRLTLHDIKMDWRASKGKWK